jgi:sulfate transporter 4
MPILSWLPSLDCATVKADLIAGLTVGVMVIPQSMSYASIAGLQFKYGMYSACVPTMIYALFGQSKQLAVGPVAMVSLLVEAGLRGKLTQEECPAWDAAAQEAGKEQYDVCPDAYANLAILTALCVGVMQIAARFLKLGFLVSFLGHPVISGFTSGAAIIIGLSQVKYVLGYSVAKSEFVHETVANLVESVDKTKPVTLCLGLACIFFLFANKAIAQRVRRLSRIGALGPLIACLLTSLLVWLVSPLRDKFEVDHVEFIPSGVMPISFGNWNLSHISQILPTAVSATLIGYMESIAIGKSLATQNGYEIEAGQELFALGISNVVGSMFSCYPVTGSFSRSAVNNATGSRSQFSGLVTSLVMLCTLMFLTPLFYYLPKFTLAAIVISSVIPLVAVGEAMKLWRVRKRDFLLWIVAFLGTLFLGVLVGIGIAVLLSLLIVIHESVRPQIAVLWRIPGTTIYRNFKQETNGSFIPSVFIARIGSSLYFANANYVKDELLTNIRSLHEVNKIEYLVLEMTPVISIDATAIHVLEDIVKELDNNHDIKVAFAMVGNRAYKTMRLAGTLKKIGEHWFFPSVNAAVHFCLQHQRVKKAKRKLTEVEVDCSEAQVATVHPSHISIGNEIGVSNDLHHAYTTVNINLIQDIPMAVSEITSVFQKNQIAVARAQVEPLGHGAVRHTYMVWSVVDTNGHSRDDISDHSYKLTDFEMGRLRSELEISIAEQGVRLRNGNTAGTESRARQLQIVDI